MDDEEYLKFEAEEQRRLKGKDCLEMYSELKYFARAIENIRKELYTNSCHKENCEDVNIDINKLDEKLFTLQSFLTYDVADKLSEAYENINYF